MRDGHARRDGALTREVIALRHAARALVVGDAAREPDRLAQVAARLSPCAPAQRRAFAPWRRRGVARALRRHDGGAHADGCDDAAPSVEPGRPRSAYEPSCGAVDADLVAVPARDGRRPVAARRPLVARARLRRAARAFAGRRAAQPERAAVEAEKLARLALEDARPRRRAGGRRLLLAGAERAHRVPLTDDALLAAPRAIANQRDALVRAGDGATVAIAHVDRARLAAARADIAPRAAQRARPELTARAGAEPAVAQRQGEGDRRGRGELSVERPRAADEVLGDDASGQREALARRQERAHVLDVLEVGGHHMGPRGRHRPGAPVGPLGRHRGGAAVGPPHPGQRDQRQKPKNGGPHRHGPPAARSSGPGQHHRQDRRVDAMRYSAIVRPFRSWGSAGKVRSAFPLLPRSTAPPTEHSRMLDDVHKELVSSLAKAHDALRRDVAKLRAGRANTNLLDGIRVDYYGTMTQLAQMANLAVPEPRLLTVKPWDKSVMKQVEKALRESDMGLNPQVDGDLIRIPLPPLTEERRKEFVKIARKYGEECRVTIRKARHEALDMLKEIDDGGDASADDVERAKKKAEETVAEAAKTVETIIAAKEKDIMEV